VLLCLDYWFFQICWDLQFFSCWNHFKALSAVVWVCLARKSLLCLLWFVIGGCGTWILSVLADSSFAVLHLNRCRHIIFFAIWFRSRLWVRWVGLDVFMFVLVCFYPFGLDLKPIVVGNNCFIFNGCKMVNWVRLMSPQFVVLSFILCLLYLG
jgi:hypothetical protein